MDFKKKSKSAMRIQFKREQLMELCVLISTTGRQMQATDFAEMIIEGSPEKGFQIEMDVLTLKKTSNQS